MILAFPENFSDFELLDTGNGFRLERWGKVILARPDPQAIWRRSLPEKDWRLANAIFRPGKKDEKGSWEKLAPLPQPWQVSCLNATFLLRLTPFKHTGLFAEQFANWQWMLQQILPVVPRQGGEPTPNGLRILNLFAYTGGATMVLAAAGCQVTHVDSSKPALIWAGENRKASGLATDRVRWIHDDAAKFAQREVKRGAKYDGILMDPPAFGHSPTGKTWKFNQDLPGLLADCVKLLSPAAKFLLVNGYATNSSALALRNLIEDSLEKREGDLECGELCLRQKNSRMVSTGIFARWGHGRQANYAAGSK